MKYYPAIFTKDPESKSIGVRIVDVPEAITFGKNMDDAFNKACEVLEFALEDYKTYPKITHLEDIKTQDKNSSVVLIPCRENYNNKITKTIRKNITIPSWLNDLAIKNDVCFSEVMTNALKEQLNV